MSEQVRGWLKGWAWGSMNAIDIVRAAQAFDRDGHRDPIVTQLIKGASRGQNAERAVDGIMPEDKCPSKPVVASCVSEVILPMDMLDWISETNRREFMLRMGAKDGGVASWWAALASSEQGRAFWARQPYLGGSHS